jgi:hypothetical protein
MTSPFAGPRSARQAQEIVTIDKLTSEANSVLPADPEASSNAEHNIDAPARGFQRVELERDHVCRQREAKRSRVHPRRYEHDLTNALGDGIDDKIVIEASARGSARGICGRMSFLRFWRSS